MSRFQMSKKAYEMKLNKVDMLQTKGENFTEDNVSYPAPPPRYSATEDNVSYPAPPPPYSAIFSGDVVPLGSRNSIMEEVLEALTTDDVKVLGLYGMGGAGKTTLIKEVAKRAEERKLFDEILMAVVSQDPNIRNIQDQFASKLGLSLGDYRENERAGRLHEKLEKTGKVLVILDDLWKHLDLQAVGIPCPDKHKCCKIVITTREKGVCDQMDCKNNTFSVVVLSEEEGWHLFKKMAGDCVTYAEVEPVAIEVAKECGGLPLAIVVVARALKDKNPPRWKVALRQLRDSTPTYISGMHKDVYSRLQLSYDYLDSEEIKHFFLLFSLFPEDENILIEDQMRHGMGLGLFHQAGLGGTMAGARETANLFIDMLQSACLLLGGDEGGIARVHDVVRDFCLSSIASKEQLHNLNVCHQSHVFLVKSSQLTEWPEIDCTVDYTGISLADNDIKLFPCGLDFPKLKFLLFRGMEQEVNIADSFFETMKELKVLNISWVQIPSFPPSQGLSDKLRTLRLEGCSLGEMEMIGHLKGLVVLSLSGSRFKDNTLPNGISLLTRLRLLDLSNCGRELLIPRGILSNLSRLEELYLENRFNELEKKNYEWEKKREKESEEEFYINYRGKKVRYDSIRELKSLSDRLTTLMEMHVKDVTLFPKDLFFPNLTTFRIQIGDDWILDENYSLSKAGLMVDFKGSSIAKDHGIWSLMSRCDYLQLSQMGNMKRILSDLNRDLKVLVVEKSDNIEGIIISEEDEALFRSLKCLRLHRLPKLASFCSVRQSKRPIKSQSLFTDKVLFPCLEKLELSDLHEVENIWHPELPNESFRQLKELEVTNCKKVPKIIPACMHPRLPKLRSLKVEMCASVEEVFEEQDLSTATGGGLDLYPHLTSLRLTGLSKLTHASLNAFLNLDSLTDLYIQSCDSFTSLFRPSIAKRLVYLEKLVVDSCEEIQEIVGEDKEEESEKVIVFPKVKWLTLCKLPKLTGFIKGDHQPKWQKCQNASSKKSEDGTEPIAPTCQNNLGCPRFQPLFNQKVLFPCLEELALEDLLEVETIWHPEFPNESFLQLKKLEVTNCKKVPKIIPACMHPRLPKLQSLNVEMCASVEEVFEQQDLSTATGGGLDLYPHLTSLRLTELSKLTHAPLNAFLNLDSLTDLCIFGCDSLTSLFQPSIAEGLVNLRTLTVKSCKEIQEIVGEDKEEETEKVIVFPKLDYLRLESLPKLTSFIKGDYQLKRQKCQNAASKNSGGGAEPIAPPSQNNLGCPRFQPLFNYKVAFPSLTWMSLYGLEGIKQIWGSQFPMESFTKLTTLLLLVCNELEVVIGKEGEEEEIISGGNLVFPQLKTLGLYGLENIRCFSESNLYTLEFPSLDEMTLLDCPKMTTFSYTSATTPKLEQISVAVGSPWREEHIPMINDINTVVKDIFLQQVKGQVNRSTGKEEEVEEMESTGEEEEGKEKDEIKSDGPESSKSRAYEE